MILSALKKYMQVLFEYKEETKGIAGYQWTVWLEKILLWKINRIGPRLTLLTEWKICSHYWIIAPTLRSSLGSIRKENVKKTQANPPVVRQIHPKWYCEVIQIVNPPVCWARPWDAQYNQVPTPTFNEGRGVKWLILGPRWYIICWSWYLCCNKGELPTSMHDELENKDNYYCSVPHKEWYDLMSTMGAKDNRKRDESQTKILAASRSSPDNYYTDTSTRVFYMNESRTGFLPSHKHQGHKNPNHSGSQCCCMLCKKAVMHGRK